MFAEDLLHGDACHLPLPDASVGAPDVLGHCTNLFHHHAPSGPLKKDSETGVPVNGFDREIPFPLEESWVIGLCRSAIPWSLPHTNDGNRVLRWTWWFATFHMVVNMAPLRNAEIPCTRPPSILPSGQVCFDHENGWRMLEASWFWLHFENVGLWAYRKFSSQHVAFAYTRLFWESSIELKTQFATWKTLQQRFRAKRPCQSWIVSCIGCQSNRLIHFIGRFYTLSPKALNPKLGSRSFNVA